MGGRVKGVERAVPVSGREAEAAYFTLSERLRELEAENARLKSLVGELLVSNQMLRDCGDQSALKD